MGDLIGDYKLINHIFDFIDWAVGTLEITYYSCTFNKDFGVYKSGQNVNAIRINYHSGLLEVFNNSHDSSPNWKVNVKAVIANS